MSEVIEEQTPPTGTLPAGEVTDEAPAAEVAEVLAFDPKAAIAKDDIRVAGAKDTDEAVGVVQSLYDKAVDLGRKLHAALARLDTGYGALGDHGVLMRQSFLLPSGVPDWAGKTTAYKAAMRAAIDAAIGTDMAERRVTVVNGVQKSIRRKVHAAIVQYVKDNGPEDGWQDLTEGREYDSPAFKTEVLRQYDRASENLDPKSPEAKNAPLPPEEYRSRQTPPQGGGDGGGTEVPPSPDETEREAAGLREVITRGTLKLDILSVQLLQAMQAFYQAATGPEPHFGEGRAVVVDNLDKVNTLSGALSKVLSDSELTAGEKTRVAESLA